MVSRRFPRATPTGIPSRTSRRLSPAQLPLNLIRPRLECLEDRLVPTASSTPYAGAIINTYAGTGTSGFSGDAGPATAAEVNLPLGIAVDNKGDVFIADTNNNRIREISPTGVITTIAGNGTAGYGGDTGPAISAELDGPEGIAVDSKGDVFFTDALNHVIREINTSGIITTIAGTGTSGFSGDGGAATNATLSFPFGLVLDSSGDLFFVDGGNNRIREVTASGIIQTVAGNGSSTFSGDGGQATAAGLDSPEGVAVDGSGNLFIADSGDNRVREVNTSGIINTYAGNGTSGSSGNGGAATAGELAFPIGVAVDSSGNLFIADALPSSNQIREVTTAGTLYTIAGAGNSGFSGDGGLASNATINNPHALAVDSSGDVFVSDYGNARIRVITPESQLAASSGNNQSATVGTNVTTPPSIIATDANGNPVAGVTVTFAVASGGGSITGATAVTNSSGIATVGSWTLGTTSGTNTLSVTAIGLPTALTLTATGTAGSPTAVAPSTGNNQFADAGTAVATPPSVIVTDKYGNGVPDVSVTFTVASGGGSITNATTSTNADGIATVGSWTLGTTPGVNTLSVTANGVATATTISAKAAGVPTEVQISTGNSQYAQVNTAVATPPAVLVTDALGTPVPNASVTFTVVSGGGSITGGTATTNDVGVATVGSWTLGSSPGANSLSAAAQGVTGMVTFMATAAGAPAHITINAGNNQTAAAGDPVTTNPSVLVTDAAGTPVPGVTVTFTVTAGSGMITGGTATTNGVGIATIGSWTLGQTEGTNTLSATVTGVSTPVTFTAKGVPGIPVQVAISAGNDQTAQPGYAVAIAPSVLVTDAYGNPVPGASVIFSILSGNGTVTGATAVTNAQGIATVGSWMLGKTSSDNSLLVTGATGSTIGNSATFTAEGIFIDDSVGQFDNTGDVVPGSSVWFLSTTATAGPPSAGEFAYGASGWDGVVGDWTGQGFETVGVVNPTSETWYLRNENSAGGPDAGVFQYGAPGWTPLAGSWDGSIDYGIGAFNPTTATWYLRNEASSGAPDAGVFQFGLPGWIPVVGDWTDSGVMGIGVVDPSTNTWYLRNSDSAGPPDFVFQFGAPGWKPVVADWGGNGVDTPAVVDPSGTWYISTSNSAGPPSVAPFSYGLGAWKPIGGNFTLPNLDAEYASAGPGPGAAAQNLLTTQTLQAAVSTALAQLSAAGVSANVLDQLAQAHYVVAPLSGTLIGSTNVATATVTLSPDAAGYGWYLDTSAAGQSAFTTSAQGSLTALPGSAAAGHEDLLTVVLHEMTHLIGKTDVPGTGVSDDLLSDLLAPGVRRIDALDAIFSEEK